MAGTARFGMVGLGTMGKALTLNIAEHGYPVVGFDLDPAKAQAFTDEGSAKGAKGFSDAREFVAALEPPRTIMFLVPAGAPVDSVIATLSPLLEPNDFLIDGGNSYFKDTERRGAELKAKQLGFIGIGVSGGEEGARHGPSMMAGGDQASYERVRPLLEAVAAKAEGEPCVKLLGPRSAGHYVKMVHNGIEYGIMQLLAETYDMMHRGLGMSNADMASVFESWNGTEIGGFLIQIASDVLRSPDPDTGRDLIDLVKDKAKQKGTGKWTSQEAMDLGVPLPTIDAAVAAREMSGLKEERERASAVLPLSGVSAGRAQLLGFLEQALYVAMVGTYAQGFAMLRSASGEHEFELNLEDVASVWRAGCIIRSGLLPGFMSAFSAEPELENLMVAPSIAPQILARESALREVCRFGIDTGIPTPCYAASLAYLDGYRSARLPANFIQAQRDYFGAHTYERMDKEGVFHSHWGPQHEEGAPTFPTPPKEHPEKSGEYQS